MLRSVYEGSGNEGIFTDSVDQVSAFLALFICHSPVDR